MIPAPHVDDGVIGYGNRPIEPSAAGAGNDS